MEGRRSRRLRHGGKSGAGRPVRPRIERPVLLSVTCVVLILALTLGGAPNRVGPRFDTVVFGGAVLLGFAVWSGALFAFQKLPFWFRLFVASVMTLPLMQLIPLPPSIWRSFPGRETARGVFDLVGAGLAFHPLSLDPLATLVAWLSLLPGFAIFLAAITLGDRERRYLALVVVGVAAVSIAIGLFQFGSRGIIFNFYDSAHRQYLIGFFANRNHEALFLSMSAIWFAFLIETERHSRADKRVVLAMMLFLVGGAIVATFSRSGVALFLLVSALLGYRTLGKIRRKRLIGAALGGGGLLLAAFLVSSNHVVTAFFARYGTVGDDSRWNFWVVSWHVFRDNFPTGSGLGTFVPMYAAYEPLTLVTPLYVNHAHNDYLELVLETGMAGVTVLFFGLSLLVLATVRLRPWGREHPSGILLMIVLLAAFHSIVDYPLRTIAISCVVALALAEIIARWRCVKNDMSSLAGS